MRRILFLVLGSIKYFLVRVIIPLICGGITYSLWMAAFLLVSKSGSQIVEGILWLLAPVVTASGFTTGIRIIEHFNEATDTGFFPIFVWPLIGCALGAIAVYWHGPMLIVFSMLAAGAASIFLRDIVLISRNRPRGK